MFIDAWALVRLSYLWFWHIFVLVTIYRGQRIMAVRMSSVAIILSPLFFSRFLALLRSFGLSGSRRGFRKRDLIAGSELLRHGHGSGRRPSFRDYRPGPRRRRRKGLGTNRRILLHRRKLSYLPRRQIHNPDRGEQRQTCRLRFNQIQDCGDHQRMKCEGEAEELREV